MDNRVVKIVERKIGAMTIQQIIDVVRDTRKVLTKQHVTAKGIEKEFKRLVKSSPNFCKK